MTRHRLLYFLARGGAGLLTVGTLAAFTRMLPPAEYGLYALGVTVASITSTLLFQWLNVAIGRFYPMFMDRPGVLLAAALRPVGLPLLLAVALFLAALPFARPLGGSPPFLLVVLLITLLLGVHNLFLQVANSQGRPLRFALLGWLKGGGTLAAGVGLMFLGAGHLGALLGAGIGLLLAAVLGTPLRGVRRADPVETGRLTADLLAYGLPLVFTFVGGMAVDFADRLLIAGKLGTAAVGRYAAAYDLASQTIGAVTNVLFLAAFPAVVHAFEHLGEDAARNQMRSLGRSLVGLALPAAVGFAAVSGDIAKVLLGASFRDDAVIIMPIMALALWLSGFKSFYLDVVFQIRRVTSYQAWMALLMAAANIALNVAFLTDYGIAAAAWATLAAFALGSLLSFILGRGLMSLHPLRIDLLKASAACGLMVAAIHALPGPRGIALLGAKVVVGGLIYLSAAWLLDVGGARAWLAERWSSSRGA